MSETNGEQERQDPSLLDETGAEIAKSLIDEYFEVDDELYMPPRLRESFTQSDIAEIVDKVLGTLVEKGFIKHDALVPSTNYIFADLRPHPESPISDEAFGELDNVIKEVNDQLGIGNRDRYFALSEGKDGEPAVSVGRYEGPDELRVLDVSITDKGVHSNVMARNDAGTFRNPNQVAGSRTVFGKSGTIAEKESVLPNQELVDVTKLVAERLEQQRFTKKEQTIRL